MENNSNGNGNTDEGGSGVGTALIIFFLICIIVGTIALVVWKVNQDKNQPSPGSGGPGGPGGAPGPWVTVPMGQPAVNITKLLTEIGKGIGVAAAEAALVSLIKRDGKIRQLLKNAVSEIKLTRSFATRAATAKAAVLPTRSYAAFVRANISRLPLQLLAKTGMRMTGTKVASSASSAIAAADRAAMTTEINSAKAAASAGARAASAAAKAEGAGARVAAGASGGPVFLAADLAFTAATIALDVKNVGNLADMHTASDYVEMRKIFDKNIEDTYVANQLPSVQFGGPLEVLSQDALDLAVMTEMYNVISEPTDQEATTVARIINSMKARWVSQGQKTMTQADLEFSLGDRTILSENEYKELASLGMDRACVKQNGQLFDPLKTGYNKICSFKEYGACTAASHYPPPEDDKDHQYFEWRTLDYFRGKGFNTANFPSRGACVHSSSGFREFCEDNQKTDFGQGHDDYDPRDSQCYNNYNTCVHVKRVQYDSSRRTCYVEPGQEFAELLFGTTVVRGLSGSFAPDGPINKGLNDTFTCSVM